MRLKREKLKLEAPTSFSRFLGYSNPKYELEWFHKLIADHCQMLLEGKIKNLMVFMPPQHGKSEIISRNFPAWALGQNPDLKIVGCSYSSDLAQQFSRSIQRTIDSKEYQAIFPATYLNGSNTRMDARGYLRNIDLFEMVGHRGFYKAVGVGGSLTGTPVDIAIIDDPVKDANEANSITYRQRVWDWYNTVLSTRLHNNSRQLFIMTRWHEDDLAGRILKAEPQEWTILAIPAICEQEYDGGLSERHIGDALWPSRHSIEKLQKQKARAPREFNALYQQHPTIEGGNIVKRDWFRTISLAEFRSLRFNEPIHFYLDTAYNKKKKGQDNDPSGVLAACRIRNYIYLIDAQKVYKEMPDLCGFCLNTSRHMTAIPRASSMSSRKPTARAWYRCFKKFRPSMSSGHPRRPMTRRCDCGPFRRVWSADGCSSSRDHGTTIFSMKYADFRASRTTSSSIFSDMRSTTCMTRMMI